MDQRDVAEDRDDREHIDPGGGGDIERRFAGVGRAEPFPDRAGDRVQRRELRQQRQNDRADDEQENRARNHRKNRKPGISPQHREAFPGHRPATRQPSRHR